MRIKKYYCTEKEKKNETVTHNPIQPLTFLNEKKLNANKLKNK